jgi:hypothetical protein
MCSGIKSVKLCPFSQPMAIMRVMRQEVQSVGWGRIWEALNSGNFNWILWDSTSEINGVSEEPKVICKTLSRIIFLE